MTFHLIFITIVSGSITPFVINIMREVIASKIRTGYKVAATTVFLLDLLVLLYLFVGSILILSGVIQ